MPDAGRTACRVVPITMGEALDLLAPAAAERAATPPAPPPPAPTLEVRMEKGAIEVVVPPPPPVQVHVDRTPEREKVLEFRDPTGRLTKTARLKRAEE
jgi:hypothetical protein